MATSDSWQRADAKLSPAEWEDESTRSIELGGKRAFDLVLSVTGLVLGFPVMAVGAAVVRVESRGPVFSRTRCWGRGARAFERLCLRTTDAEGSTDARRQGASSPRHRWAAATRQCAAR